MNYKRQEIDAGAFSNMMPDGAKVYIRPELPKVEYKVGNVKLKVTDLRLLHPAGVEALFAIIKHMCEVEGDEELTFSIPKDTDNETVDAVADIVTGFEYEAKFRRWSYECGCTVYGFRKEESNGERTITFTYAKEFANFVYEYAKKHGTKLSLVGILAEYANKRFKDMVKARTETTEENNDGE